MQAGDRHPIGRESELEALGGFLEAPESFPRAAALAGEAGIGKTTLWLAACEVAARRGYQVLTRDCPDGVWTEPVHLDAPLNTPASETRASLSWDGRQMVFGSNRPGSELGSNGQPSNDIYLAVRG